MKILFTSDWHIGITSFGVINEDGRNSRIVDFEYAAMKTVEIAVQEKVDLYFHGGDIFHTSSPKVEEQRAFFRILRALELRQIPSRFIIGNHDHTNKLGAVHALKLFMDFADHMQYVKIYDKTTIETFYENTQNLRVAFMPFNGQQPDFEKLKPELEGDRSALICHSHLEGAVVGAEPFEIKSDHATKFRSLPVDFVLAGHFHKPQLLCEKPLALYPGSICPVDFNERHDVKGVVIIDTEARTYKCIGIKVRDLHQIDIDWTTNPNADIGTVDIVGNIVKVNIKMGEEHVPLYDEKKIRDAIMFAGAQSIASINLEVVKKEVVRSREIKSTEKIQANFDRYLELKDCGEIKPEVQFEGRKIIDDCSRD